MIPITVGIELLCQILIYFDPALMQIAISELNHSKVLMELIQEVGFSWEVKLFLCHSSTYPPSPSSGSSRLLICLLLKLIPAPEQRSRTWQIFSALMEACPCSCVKSFFRILFHVLVLILWRGWGWLWSFKGIQTPDFYYIRFDQFSFIHF